MQPAKLKRYWILLPAAAPRRWRPCHVLREKAGLLRLTGEWAAAERLHRELAASAAASADRAALADARTDLASMLLLMGAIDEAFDLAAEARPLWDALGDDRGLARCITTLGSVHYQRSEYPKAMEYYREGLAIAQRGGDAMMSCRALGRIGLLHYDMGESQRSLEVLDEALAAAERMGSHQLIASSSGNLGNVHLEQGRYEEAMACYQRAYRESLRIGDKQSTAFSEGNIAIIHEKQGRYAEAMEWTLRQLQAFRELGDRVNLAVSLLNIGNIHSSRGEYGTALARYGEVIALARANRDKPILSYALYLSGTTLQELGRPEEVERFLAEAVAVAEEIGFNHYLCGYQSRLARHYVERGDPVKAAALAAAARELAEKVGRAEVLFELEVTGALLAADGRAGQAARLTKLAGRAPEPEQEAGLQKRLFDLTGDQARRQAAADAYRKLYGELPKHSYRKALEELGALTPAPSPD